MAPSDSALCLVPSDDYFADFTSTNDSTLFRSRIDWVVVVIAAEAPLLSSGWTLLTRFVQIVPPRRLGSGMKFAARASNGVRMALSFMNSRSIVLRAASRVIIL